MNNRVCVIIPTRNRPELAISAVASVLPVKSLTVIVSDNSSDLSARQSLQDGLRKLGRRDVALVAPPAPLSMPDHWSWALDKALASEASHFTILTDRMVFNRRGFRRVLDIAESSPERIISYNHDRCEDVRSPVKLISNRWTGDTFEASSEVLTRFAAGSESHAALPRMLNSLTPRPLLQQMRSQFGAVFAGVAPDFYFGFRVISLTPSVLYADIPVLLHAHLDRSNGALMAKGVSREDHEDFLHHLPNGGPAPWAPRPEIATVGNVVISEYCSARADIGASRFPLVDRDSYERRCLLEVSKLAPDLRARMETKLSQTAPDGRHLSVSRADCSEMSVRRGRGHSTRVSQIVGLGLAAVVPVSVWNCLATAPTTTRFLRFKDRDQAVCFWHNVGRRRSKKSPDVAQFARVRLDR